MYTHENIYSFNRISLVAALRYTLIIPMEHWATTTTMKNNNETQLISSQQSTFDIWPTRMHRMLDHIYSAHLPQLFMVLLVVVIVSVVETKVVITNCVAISQV